MSSETAHSDPAKFSWISYLASFQSNRARRVEVIVKLPGNIFDHFLRLHAVASLIERRSKHSDGAFARGDGDDSATNTALRRKADMPGPSSGTIVEARHRHGCEDMRNVCAFDDLFARR